MCMIIDNFNLGLKCRILKISVNGAVFVVNARLIFSPITFSAMNVKSPLPGQPPTLHGYQRFMV